MHSKMLLSSMISIVAAVSCVGVAPVTTNEATLGAGQLNGGLKASGFVATEGFVVALTGLDTNPGTLALPFRTIQKCASLIKPGKSCVIRAGTYRETVRPTVSGSSGAPIGFRAYGDGPVLVSGADVIAGFAPIAGGRFRANLGWDLGTGKNQVFLNGKMLLEARFPNATDLFNPNSYGKFINPRGSGTTWTIDAPGLPSMNLAGANINLLPGPEWVIETGTITASSGSSFTFSSPGGQMNERPDFAPDLYAARPGNPYFLWGKLDFLDAANEWFAQPGLLYLGQNPTGKTLEVKRRALAFDLTDRSFMNLQGIQVFAATIATGDPNDPLKTTSSNVILDGVHVRYPSHFTNIRPTLQESAWIRGLDTGVMLLGRNHVLKNSSVAWSAGNGVLLGGTNHVLENNVIHHVDYGLTDAAAVFTGPYNGTSSGHRIERNTLRDAARSVIVHRNTKGLRILRNQLYNGGLMTNDLGLTYTYESDGAGTEIAYNLVHDNFAPSESMGIYLDNGSKNFLVHHNVVYNVRNAMNLNLPSLNNRIYNNTFVGWNESVGGGAARLADCDATGTLVANNILVGNLNLGGTFSGGRCPNASATPALGTNLLPGRDPKFAATIRDDYSLGLGSPAIDTGKILAPYTNGYRGAAPDLGALEVGTPLNAGSTLSVPCVYGDTCPPPPTPRYGANAEYFADEILQKSVLVRPEPTLSLEWYGAPPPNVPKTNWSARFQSTLEVPKTGTYTFWLTADDGARLWMNGVQRVNRWDYRDPPVDSFTLPMSAGQLVPLRLESHEGSGGGAVRLEWAYPGQPRQILPRRQLLRP
jgi:PA14 domain/Right handed beta helix region